MSRWLLLLLLSCTVALHSADLSPDEYRRQLTAVATAIDANHLPEATALSEQLAAAHVAWPTGTLAADPRIHAALAASHPGTARRRLAELLSALAADEAPTTAMEVPPDREALAAIARHQTATLLASGGTLDGLELHAPVEVKPLALRLLDAFRWLSDLLGDFLEWIRWVFGGDVHKTDADKSSGLTTTAVLVGLGVIVVVFIVLALRRSATPPLPTVQPPLPIDAAADQDPRSRAADEWIQHARRLGAAGRHREAVRAWFHALLVTCWARGHLHHRVGRTNWEYAVTLPGSLPWGEHFRDLTARFDRTWYGGQDDADYALDAEAVLSRINLPAERSS